MNTKIIERSGDGIANIDETSKNKFCWSWMERSIEVYPKKISKKSSWNGGLVTIFYKTHIWKIQEDGVAVCTLCKSKTLVYEMRGVSAIKYQLVMQEHVGNIITTMSSFALPGCSSDERNSTYAIAPKYESETVNHQE